MFYDKGPQIVLSYPYLCSLTAQEPKVTNMTSTASEGNIDMLILIYPVCSGLLYVTISGVATGGGNSAIVPQSWKMRRVTYL